MRSFTKHGKELRSLSRAFSSQAVQRTVCKASTATALATPTPIQQSAFQQPLSRSIHTTKHLRKSNDTASSRPPTDFGELDVLGGTPPPSTSVDVCMSDGFALNSGITITDGDGAMLVNGEAFAWRPWRIAGKMELVNKKGQFELPPEAFSMLDMLWPRPGTGGQFCLRWRYFYADDCIARPFDYRSWTEYCPAKPRD
jgi:hypothetical protein